MISVCIATYNGEKYIKEQIESILPQLSEDDEIIVSDDCSTDSTLDVVRDFNDRRIKIVHHNKQKEKFILDYSTHNFEYALQQAKGNFIFLCDQDDVWLPNKVRKMMDDLEKGYLISICDCKVCSSNLKVEQDSYFKANGTSLGYFNLIVFFRMLGCCMAIRKELLDLAIPFPKTKVGHDVWLVLLARYYKKAHMINEPLHLYRRHEDTVTCAGDKSIYPIWFRIYLRLFIVSSFLKKIIMLNIKKHKQ